MKKLLAALLFCLALSGTADAAARFAVCSVACTWDGSSTAMWSTSSGGATGASVPGSADTVTFDASTCVAGVTCTITTNTDPTITSLAFGACTASTTGCILDFSVNNNSITVTGSAGFNISGTGTRNLKMGSGTFTLSSTTASSTVWNAGTTTNLTFAAGTSTIALTGNNATGGSRVFAGGGLTYNIVSFSANGAGGGTSITGANTIGTFSATCPNTFYWPASTTNTITNAPTLTGSSGCEFAFLSATQVVGTISIASGTMTASWFASRSMAYTGGATFTFTNATDLGNTTGASFTAPSGGGGGGTVGFIGGGL